MRKAINRWVKRAAGIYLAATMTVAVPVYADVIPPVPTTTVQDTGTVAEETYLGGAELTLLAPATQSQNLSCVIETKAGSLIVVDGGLREDAPHLIETIQAKGGRVSAWLITQRSHRRSDGNPEYTADANRD